MKLRNIQRHGDEKAALQMTAMIDIVFLLLVFFIMTLKIVSPEGDFDIRMPPETGETDHESWPIPPIHVRMLANADGSLRGVQMNTRTLSRQNPLDDLHLEIRQIIGDDTGPGSVAESTEVELDCDYNLDFKYVIAAITAVSGHVTDDGNVVKLVEKIKFSPPNAP